ncbi:hypothetical protein C4565_03720 [Candidatus Parcubacteria bacterium]|nr:MAG: hypothetical protein C4565_03720 [Candidatus Parcubacteria bacterium]
MRITPEDNKVCGNSRRPQKVMRTQRESKKALKRCGASESRAFYAYGDKYNAYIVVNGIISFLRDTQHPHERILFDSEEAALDAAATWVEENMKEKKV